MSLLKDAKFLTAALDAVMTISLYVVATYMPQYADFAKIVWASLQPLFLAIIAAVVSVESRLRALDVRVFGE